MQLNMRASSVFREAFTVMLVQLKRTLREPLECRV